MDLIQEKDCLKTWHKRKIFQSVFTSEKSFRTLL